MDDQAEPAEPLLEVKDQQFDDEGAPVIRTAESLPERLKATDAMDPLGELYSCVEGLLCVRGEEDSRALDLQSVVCTKDGEVLGVVLDIFGPVTQPHYLVHTTKQNHPKIGTQVYAATGLAETSYLCDSADPVTLRQKLADRMDDSNEEDESEEESSEQEDIGNAEQSLAGRLLGEFATERGSDGSGKGKGKGKSKGKSKGKGKKGKQGKAEHRQQEVKQEEDTLEQRSQGEWSYDDSGSGAKRRRTSGEGGDGQKQDRWEGDYRNGGSASSSAPAGTGGGAARNAKDTHSLPPPPAPPAPPPAPGAASSIFVPTAPPQHRSESW